MPRWVIRPYKTEVYRPEHEQNFRNLNMRPVALSMYGYPFGAQHAVIFQEMSTTFAGTEWFGRYSLTLDDIESAYQSFSSDHRALLVAAMGPASNARFSLIVTKVPSGKLKLYTGEKVKFNLKSGAITDNTTFQFWNAWAHANNYILTSASMYGTGADPRFAAIWKQNPRKVVWDYTFLHTAYEYQALFNAYAEGLLRPQLFDIAWTPAERRYMVVWRDDVVAGWYASGPMPKHELDAAIDERPPGFWPIGLTAGGSGTEPSFIVTLGQYPKRKPLPRGPARHRA